MEQHLIELALGFRHHGDLWRQLRQKLKIATLTVRGLGGGPDRNGGRSTPAEVPRGLVRPRNWVWAKSWVQQNRCDQRRKTAGIHGSSQIAKIKESRWPLELLDAKRPKGVG